MANSTSNKPHIVLYIGSLTRGGAERVMVNLASYLYEQGWQVTFVTTYLYPNEYEVPHAAWTVTGQPGPAGEGGALNPIGEQERVVQASTNDGSAAAGGAQQRGICRVLSGLTEAETGRSRLLNIWRRTRKLTRIFRELHPDVILSFLGKNNVMALQCGRAAGIPVVVSVRSNPAREYADARLNRQMRRLFPKAAAVVLQTRTAVDFFPGNVQQRAVVLSNSVNPAFLEPNDRGDVTNRVAVDATSTGADYSVRKTIISVGRLDANKNQQLLIRTFAQMYDKFPDWSLVLYGDGPQMEEDRALAADLGIADAVTFTGAVDGIRERIAQDGIFVLTSRQEGMPNALLEAMALGLPCISTDCAGGGPRDIVRDHDNGILIPVDDENALQLALHELMVNRSFAERLGQTAAHDMQAYAPDIVNQRWEEVLLGAMQSR